ncbi:winged helix-turn-helix transcriptional regulator [Rhodococcus sp. NPDC058521]|uniref:winged helix-turn-helix transcriptional regulator n=1 Tax=Rhodococcus sp. NPDC058521 TaxID=3346536 RepID=UPI0036640350
MLILWALRDGPKRFGETRRLVLGVTDKMLIQQLSELEDDAIVHRAIYHQVPPKVEYSLTELGISLNNSLEPASLPASSTLDLLLSN